MKLKDSVKTLDEVDEKYHDLYEKQGEEFVLTGVDGAEALKKVKEFRNQNIELTKKAQQYEGMLKSFEGIDPQKWKEAKEALVEKERLLEKELLDKGQIEELFAKRFQAAEGEWKRQLGAKDDALKHIQDEASKLKQKLGSHLIDAEVQKAVIRSGKLRDGAIEDVISRARRMWNLDEAGNIIPKKNGEVVYGRNGDQLTIEEWAADLPTEAPHLFQAAAGGGAEGGSAAAKKNEKKTIPNDPVLIGKHMKEILAGKVTIEGVS